MYHVHVHAQSNCRCYAWVWLRIQDYFVKFLISPICKNKAKYKFPGIRYYQNNIEQTKRQTKIFFARPFENGLAKIKWPENGQWQVGNYYFVITEH